MAGGSLIPSLRALHNSVVPLRALYYLLTKHLSELERDILMITDSSADALMIRMSKKNVMSLSR